MRKREIIIRKFWCFLGLRIYILLKFIHMEGKKNTYVPLIFCNFFFTFMGHASQHWVFTFNTQVYEEIKEIGINMTKKWWVLNIYK